MSRSDGWRKIPPDRWHISRRDCESFDIRRDDGENDAPIMSSWDESCSPLRLDDKSSTEIGTSVLDVPLNDSNTPPQWTLQQSVAISNAGLPSGGSVESAASPTASKSFM